MVYKMKNVR